MQYTIRQFKLRFAGMLIIALSMLAGLGVCEPAQAEIIFSEIMYNPDGTDVDGGSFNKEWVEIYNTGASSVDLSGWVFDDIQDMSPSDPIPNGISLAAGEALVLVGDATSFDSQWGSGINRLELGNFPTLSNSPSPTNEILALRNSLSVIQDQVNYDDENGWPTDSPDGPSMFVLPGNLNSVANDVGSNWHRSTFGVYGAYSDGSSEIESAASPGVVVAQPTNFTPSPDAAWSMVFFPDTQNYVKSSPNQSFLTGMTEWVRDNRAAWKIQVVLQGGDVVNKNSNENPSSGENPSTLQWQNAKAAFSILDGEVPYILSAGNHDFGTNNAENRNTRLNDFFSASDNPLVDPAQGGILKGFFEAGKLENAYYEMIAPDGRKMLIFSLEWGPRDQIVNLANQIVALPEFADHTAVLLTHAYMYQDGTRHDWNRNLDADPNNDQGGNPHDSSIYDTANDPAGTHDGEELWNELVKQNGNFEIVLNGHIGGDGAGNLSSTGDAGNQVQQIGFNTQFQTNGGNGWIRMMEFLDDGKTIRVRTYSPSLDFVRVDLENDFFFEIEPLLTADFDADGDIDNADFQIWSTNYGNTSTNFSQGDANRDGTTDGLDFLLWQSLFEPEIGAVVGSATVPEPSSFFLLLLAILLVFPVWAEKTVTVTPLSLGQSGLPKK